MSKLSSKKENRYSNIIMTASVTLIILLHLFPLTVIEIPPSSPYFLAFAEKAPELLIRSVEDPENATLYIYNNYHMMQKSFDDDLIELSNKVTIIIALTWINLILGLLSYIGLMLNILEEKISTKIRYISCLSIFTSAGATLFIIDFILKNQSTQNIENASIIFIDLPFKYIYILLIISIISLLGAVYYTRLIISNKGKKKKILKEDEIKESDKRHTVKKSNVDNKKIASRTKNRNKKDLKFRLNKPINTTKVIKEPESEQKGVVKEQYNPFKSEKKNKLDNEKIGKNLFDEKRKKVKKFNVKCPKCGNIFEAEKQPDGFTKIKCPKCGKQGVIK